MSGTMKRNYSATVTSPSNVNVKCEVEQSNGDDCCVRFSAVELGDYIIRTFQDGSADPFKEFTYHVTEKNCEVTYTTSTVNANTSWVDANKGSRQRYRASITTENNIEIDCDFEELDDERCQIRFVPRTVGDHRIKIFNLANNKVVNEFTFVSGKKNVGHTTTFTINVQEYKPKLSASIISPSNAPVECTVEESIDENWIIKFVPNEIGDHVVKLFKDESNEPTTQFVYSVVGKTSSTSAPGRDVYRVGETAKLKCNIDGRMVKPSSEFSVTVISPSNNLVNCFFDELDDGTCKVRFVPKEVGKYTIKLYKVGREAPISEFPFIATEEIRDETADFTITVQEKRSKFSAKVISPSNQEVDCVIDETDAGRRIVRFTPTEVGDYTIQIFESNGTLPVATIIYTIVEQSYDISQKSSSKNISRVGELTTTNVDIAEAQRKLSVTVTSPSNEKIECSVDESDDGKCSVKFQPNEDGDYKVRVYQGSNPIPVSEFTYTIKHREPASFNVNVNQPSNYTATVTSPSGEDLHCRVEETDSGSCRVRFMPTDLGDYVVRIFQDDMQISQFNCKVSELQESANTLDEIFKLEEKVSFYRNPGENTNKFSASVTSPGHTLLDCDVVEKSPNEFVIRFTPKELGDHVIKIYNDDTGVPIYQFIYKVRALSEKPLEFNVTSSSTKANNRLAYKIKCTSKSTTSFDKREDSGSCDFKFNSNTKGQSSPILRKGAEKCSAKGEGLRKANVGKETSFEVDTRDAGKGSLVVGIEGPKQPAKGIELKHIGQDVYSVKYVLDMKGEYSLYVMWGGQHIPGSPFTVTV